jgi:adenylylsulfate kinase-like enzyme
MIYLITGQPGTGKTTAANELETVLKSMGREQVMKIDGDHIRKVWPYYGYKTWERVESGRNIMFMVEGLLNARWPSCDIIISIVAPVWQVRNSFHMRFTYNIVELRMTHIYEKRPDEYYPAFHTPKIDTYKYKDAAGLEQLKNDIIKGVLF